MRIEGAICVVTGGGGGIGEALVAGFVREGAEAIVVTDRSASAAADVAKKHGGGTTKVVDEALDASDGAAIERLIRSTEERFGRVDIVVSNAGLMHDGGLDLPLEIWERSWQVNTMAHVHAARAAMPGMLARGRGYFLNVSSAAGMLLAPGAAAYTATKHAANGFAEWLAIAYADKGIGVSVLCPEAVQTNMLAESLAGGNAGVRKIAETGPILTATEVADSAIAGMKEDRFLLLPHPNTLKNTQRKWADMGRWLAGMRGYLKSL